MAHVVRRTFQHRDLQITLAVVETAGHYRISAFAEGDNLDLWPMSWTDHTTYASAEDALSHGSGFACRAADARILVHAERQRRRLQDADADARPAPVAA